MSPLEELGPAGMSKLIEESQSSAPVGSVDKVINNVEDRAVVHAVFKDKDSLIKSVF
jgi:hypothetical protein